MDLPGRTECQGFPVSLRYGRTKNDGLLLSSASTEETAFEECEQTASIEAFPGYWSKKGAGHGNYITADLSQKDPFDPNFRTWISLANGSKKRTRADEWHKH